MPAEQWGAGVVLLHTERTCRPKRRIVPGSSLSGKFHFNPWTKEKNLEPGPAFEHSSSYPGLNVWCESWSPYRWKWWSQSADTLGLTSKNCNTSLRFFQNLGREDFEEEKNSKVLNVKLFWEQAAGKWRKRECSPWPLHCTTPGTVRLPFLFLLIFKINLWGGHTCGWQRTIF